MKVKKKELSELEENFYEDVKKEPDNGFAKYTSKVSNSVSSVENFFKSHTQTIKYIALAVLATGYVAYFITACVLDFNRALALVILTSLAIFFALYGLIKRYKGDSINECLKPAGKCFKANRPEQLISFGGVCMFIIVLYILSAHRRAVSWRAVFWGLCLQFVIGLIVIRTEPGLIAFQWLGAQVQTFLNYTIAGSSFVFGEELVKQAFAFQALPIVVFFSSIMSVLYYLGIMQWLIVKIAWVMQITMGTSPTETLSVAGNIFVGQTEAPLLIRPYLADMTKSEVHAVMTGGFATIAGSVMGAYISFGIDASSLISASVMAAPCALALAKLSYPETEESKFKTDGEIEVASGGEQNLLEAASNGASASIGLVANIAANLIAFLAILDFINASLRWLGGMVGYPDITFQMICSYVFMPVAFMMGIPDQEAFIAAELIGTKLFLNEFLAYERLSELKNNRINGLPVEDGGTIQWISVRVSSLTLCHCHCWLTLCSSALILKGHSLDNAVRSETICTFALCGFANFSSIGIMIGGLSSICPARRSDVSKAVMRALLTGTCVSLVNACVAGKN
ncbi:hypothetical protein JZ751_020589 [Albula glossodonta]|uniref:Sodium/nucleoside cotransporter n=1 Tax=Albula glossodonta TaxID=121402 RepID=A0A8T2PK42_9TELE|nr:hypothetical protein JZ751_020589 [Albula glossodonta]